MSDPLLDLLAEVSATFQSRLSQHSIADEVGLSPFEVRLLTLIDRFPGASQRDFGVMLDRDKGQVARAVKELESHGLIRREASKSDWRSQQLLLSEQGAEISARASRGRELFGSYALQDLSAQERETMGQALRRILHRINE